jgi:hypothetical protein
LDSNPNAKNENILTAILTATYMLATASFVYLYTQFTSFIPSIKSKAEYLRQIANALISRLYIQAYYVWSNKSLIHTHGFSTRKGFSSGREAIILVVYVVIAFLVAAILFPIAMTQVTSAVTTSWNGAVSTVYVVLLPILVVIALALHFLGAF